MDQRGLRVIGEFFEALATRPPRGRLYRGHAIESWTLTPSAFRPGANGIDRDDQLLTWNRMAARFASPQPRNSVEWLVMAQHFGIPTPLLDWTTSPLVALFFACDGYDDRDGCVVSASDAAFKSVQSYDTVPPFALTTVDRPILVEASAMNARTLAQDSAMSLHARHHHHIPAALTRLVYYVRGSDKQDTLMALRILGFTRERLFNDINVVVAEFLRSLALDQ